MNGIFLLIGGNMGDRMQYLQTVINEIGNKIGEIKTRSLVYETQSWGDTKQPAFLNQILFLQSKLNAVEVLHHILEIEKKMGRMRKKKWEARCIDIDILFFNNDIIQSSTLIIPHPLIPVRRFVLKPLAEIAPNFIHPILHKTMNELLTECPDELSVKIFNP